jgi:hypothetical protein
VEAEEADGILIAGNDFLEVIDVLLEGGDGGIIVAVGEVVAVLAAVRDTGEGVGAAGSVGIAAEGDVVGIFGAPGMAGAYAPVVCFYFALDVPSRLLNSPMVR